MKSLHCPVLHRRNPQRPEFPVRLWNIHPTKGKSGVASPFQRPQSLHLGLRGLPYDLVHPRSVLSPVFGDSLDCKAFRRQRAGQEPLQILGFCNFSLPKCLRNVHLQLFDVLRAPGPVDLVPGLRVDIHGGARSCGLVPWRSHVQKASRLSCDERPGGSLHAFASGDGSVALTGSRPIRTITGRRWLSPPSFTPSGAGGPCGRAFPEELVRGPVGLTTLHDDDTNGEVASYRPGATCPCIPSSQRNNRPP